MPQQTLAKTAPPGRALAALALSMLLSSLGTSIANVGLPTLAQAFNVPFQDVQWVVLAYLLAITTLIVSAGRLGDLIGRKRLLLGGIALFTLASCLCGMASGLGALIGSRALQGLGAAAMMALTMAFVGETVPKERTGSAMGLLGTMSAMGTALGPSLGGFLISMAGWRALFWINLPLGLVAISLARRHLPGDTAAGQRERQGLAGFDLLGTLLLALTLAAYAMAMTLGRGHFGGLNLALLMAAVLGAGFFLLAQGRAPAPLIRLAALRNAVLSVSLAVNTAVATVMMATLVVGPFYLARALELGTTQVGLVMSIGPVLSALSGVVAGRMVDRWGTLRMASAGLLAMVAGALALTGLPQWLGVAGYVAAIGVLTPGYQLVQAANNTAAMADVHTEQRGVISGLLNLSRNLGLITGASLMGAVFAFACGAANIASAPAPAVVAGMRATFALAAMLLLATFAMVRASGGRATP